MRIYKIRGFVRFARKERIKDAALIDAIDRAELGLVEADLGGGLVKQRIARAGQGRSGGYRTVIAYRRGDLAIFIFGFAKSERANIDEDELSTLKELASVLLGQGEGQIEKLVAQGDAEEVSHD